MFSKQYVRARSLWWIVVIDSFRQSGKSDRPTNPETPSLQESYVWFLNLPCNCCETRTAVYIFHVKKKKEKIWLVQPFGGYFFKRKVALCSPLLRAN